jgi:adenine deaminase
MDAELGGIAPARRADLVLLNDALEVQNTWYGGELVVERRRITPVLERALGRRFRYPRAAYATVKVPSRVRLTPALPAGAVTANVIRVVPPGIVTAHDRLDVPAGTNWPEWMRQQDLCFLTVVERHGRNGGVGHGLLRDFGLGRGAVASSVGHDAHNIVLAGTNEADLQLALATVKKLRGGVCAVRDGKVLAKVALPIAGLLSDRRAPEIAKETTALKRAWQRLGCKVPYMGFNLLPLSVIPAFRLTDKGLVDVNGMKIVPLFESSRRHRPTRTSAGN